jgi:hypothetical protein
MSTANSRSNLVPLTRFEREARCRIVSFDEEAMTNENTSAGGTAVRDIPIDWEALEDAFENNAPEVHSYLHLVTGDVLRVVDGVADPQMHARIAADANYLRIDPVSSREQYRWMERYIPMVEDPDLQAKLSQAIDGKGAFRRFKDVLMAYAPERERWFAFRSERLRIFMEAWLSAHALNPVPRPVWVPEVPARPEGVPARDGGPIPGAPASSPAVEHVRDEAIGREGGHPQQTPGVPPPRRGKSVETLRKNLREIADALGPRDLDTLTAFAEFLKARRAARSFSHHLQDPGDVRDTQDPASQAEEEAPASQEIAANEARSDSA